MSRVPVSSFVMNSMRRLSFVTSVVIARLTGIAAVPNCHVLGTAAMLSHELGGVVDEELRVYRTDNVRVVDASVIPLQVTGHLVSTIYAIAGRAADIILGARSESRKQ